MAAGWVKLCGIRTIAEALTAARANADAIGFVFAPSRRQVTVSAAKEIARGVRALAPELLIVGVFVNAAPEEINDVVDTVGLDLVQLSGDEPLAVIPQLTRPVLRSVRVTATNAEAAMQFARQAFASRKPPFALLVDAHVPGRYGGTGQRADWALAAALAAEWPVVLAGGLTPENVGEAITQVRPFGVDTSSGIETDGQKDPAKMQAFVAASRAAFALQASSQQREQQKEAVP